MSRSHLALSLVLIFYQVTACQTVSPVPSIEPSPPLLQTPNASPAKTTSSPTKNPIPTNPLPTSHPLEETIQQPAVLPMATGPAPLRFVFPEQAPPGKSTWRPPLYPTPWALSPHDHFFFSRPITANEINWPLEDYRYGGVFIPNVVHTGIDIPAPVGTPVLAVGSGKVTWAGYGLYRGVYDTTDPYGIAVAIKHDFGFQGETLYTIYGHLDEVLVQRGQSVQPGDLLGMVGQTGQVTGPHLHFEVRIGKNNYFVSRNPELWLVPPQGWGVLAAHITNTRGNFLHSYLVSVKSNTTGHLWRVKTYGEGPANPDPYYQENMVLSDLPAGSYTITILFAGFKYDLTVNIQPGMVNYIRFQGRNGFQSGMPLEPTIEFTPPLP